MDDAFPNIDGVHYLYQKNLELDGNTLYIRYRITKEGEEEFPCFWTWYGLVRYEQDMELLLPGKVAYNTTERSHWQKDAAVFIIRRRMFPIT